MTSIANLLTCTFCLCAFNGMAVYAQDIDCISCEPQCLCKEEIGQRFNDQQKEIIRNNWNDFEGENLEKPFPASVPSDVTSIRFDGLGCVYPSFMDDSRLRALFLRDWVDYRTLASRSFYMLLRKRPGALATIRPELAKQFKGLEKIANRNFSGDPAKVDSLTITNFFKFRQAWNQLFLGELIQTTRKHIQDKGIEQLYFFIPGYNVPYSLAHLQGNRVFEDIDRLVTDSDSKKKILYVRVFWPSNNKKNSVFGKTRCNIKNQKSLRSGLLNDYVTNRAYLASLSLRALLRELDPALSVNVVSHSFGAVISTGLVLSPVRKIAKSQRNSPFNQSLLTEFEIGIPRQKITLFLNAPAIPGRTTFLPLDKNQNANHHFYIGFNPKDQMLTKQVAPVIRWFTSAAKRNATTLGADWHGEVNRLKKLVAHQGLEKNFTYCPSLHKNHDYFCYRQQEAFKEHFSNYVKSTLSK